MSDLEAIAMDLLRMALKVEPLEGDAAVDWLHLLHNKALVLARKAAEEIRHHDLMKREPKATAPAATAGEETRT